MATRARQGLQDADAADLSQEVLRAVAGAVGQLDYDPSRGAFRNWLFTIVRRKLIDWRVARGNRIRGSGKSATQQFLTQVARTSRPGGVGVRVAAAPVYLGL